MNLMFMLLTFCASTLEAANTDFDLARVLADEKMDGIIVGELHGTNESPPAFLHLVSDIHADHEQVLVILEAEVASQLVQAYLDGADNRTELAAAFAEASTGDGRHTSAIFKMVEGLRELNDNGGPIAIGTFGHRSIPHGVSMAERERALLNQIEQIVASIEIRPVAILAGNIHARQTKGLPWDDQFEPVGRLIGADRFLNIEVVHAGGEAHMCRGEACRPFTVGVAPRERGAPDLGQLAILVDPKKPFDGEYAVGQVSAAQPCSESEACN